MMLRFVNARNDKKKLNEIKKLYDEAFPKEEQIPFWILRKASRTSTADLMQVYDDDLLDENCDNYEERKKRKEFYLKNGFREAGYSTREYGVEYEMLYLGGNVSYEEFLALIRKYFGRTLALMVKKNFKKA